MQLMNYMIKSTKTKLLILLLIFGFGCISQSPTEKAFERLDRQLDSLDTSTSNQIYRVSNMIDKLDSISGSRYILTLELKQSRLSLDISEHIKDGMNKIKFNIPVDKEFYESVEVGTKIKNSFRSGSFIMRGSLSNWVITVVDKTII